MSKQDERVRVKRNARRAEYERSELYQILDAEKITHVCYVAGGEPQVIPTLYLRQGDALYFHGNRQAAFLKHISEGGLTCASVMIVDGYVVARSGFHCSMNYRSVNVYGHGRLIEENSPRHRSLLDAFVNALIPGHGDAVREPSRQELAATSVVELDIEQIGGKIRTGPPADDAEDLALSVWAGEVPLQRTPLEPVPSPDLGEGVGVPEYIHRLDRT
jgi:nitroimidazol reductase NimA-like FMN-containing flavoprotein (pyridoxamine 5'-phosphate oxidase superfamily)